MIHSLFLLLLSNPTPREDSPMQVDYENSDLGSVYILNINCPQIIKVYLYFSASVTSYSLQGISHASF